MLCVRELVVVLSQEERTRAPVRIRTRPTGPQRTSPPRTFPRTRPTRPQPDDEAAVASLQPESRQRPSRPLVQLSPRPSRPSGESSRPTRPLSESPFRPVDDPLPTLPEDEDPRPLRPQLSTAAPVFRPTALPPTDAEVEVMTTVEEEEEFLPETTLPPESTARPSFSSLFPRPQATPTPTPTKLTPRPSPRTRPSPRPRPTQSPARSPRPPRPAFVRIPLPSQTSFRPVQSAILAGGGETDYYYDDLDGALTGTLGQLATLTEKAVLMADGSVQCYDTGYFAHPDSCKKFISCSKTVRGLVRGWVYTCPQQLVFDPVGGMCNWAETVDCEGL